MHFVARSKYSFKAKRPKLVSTTKDEQDLEASVRTLSALLSQGHPNIMSAHAAVPGEASLEERVAATLSAELAAAIVQQQQQGAGIGRASRRGVYDAGELEPEGEEEDELDEEPYESGPEHGPPAYRSSSSRAESPVAVEATVQSSLGMGTGPGEKTLLGPGGEVQVMIVEGLDGEEFPITLRARKGKEPVSVVSGVKRKR